MVPKPIILPIIFVLCVVGSYAISQRLFDVWVMLGFGVLGYGLRRLSTRWRRSCSAWCWAT
jgi:putative tricarboxylic transport membrane protein